MGASINLADLGLKLQPRDATFHKQTVADLLHRSTVTFPGGQPVSFARRHFRELERTDYFLCEKTDGIRCLLYCSQNFDAAGVPPREAYFLIDRKNDYYFIPDGRIHIPPPGDVTGYHTGTLIDGELVLQKMPDGRERKVYLIFDMLCLDGQNIMDRLLEIRLGKIQSQIFKPYQEFAKRYPNEIPEHRFELEMKGFQRGYAMEMMFKDIIPKLRHGNDGLIFTCKTTPYQSGTDQHILKWKPPHENSIDFKLFIAGFPVSSDADGEYEDFDAKPKMELWVNHGRDRGGYKAYIDKHDAKNEPAVLDVTDDEWERFKSLNQILDGRIIECYRDSATGRWRPKMEHDTRVPRFRDDKTDANFIDTVESVEESIVDAVSEEELIAHAGKIREAWKRREQHEAEQKKRAHLQRQQSEAAAHPPAPPPPHAQVNTQQSRQETMEDVDDGPRYE